MEHLQYEDQTISTSSNKKKNITTTLLYLRASQIHSQSTYQTCRFLESDHFCREITCINGRWSFPRVCADDSCFSASHSFALGFMPYNDSYSSFMPYNDSNNSFMPYNDSYDALLPPQNLGVVDFMVNIYTRNACEGTGRQPISSVVECQKAAKTLRLEFVSSPFLWDPGLPKGCIESTVDEPMYPPMHRSGVLFNTHSQGKEMEGYHMICKMERTDDSSPNIGPNPDCSEHNGAVCRGRWYLDASRTGCRESICVTGILFFGANVLIQLLILGGSR